MTSEPNIVWIDESGDINEETYKLILERMKLKYISEKYPPAVSFPLPTIEEAIEKFFKK